MRILVLAPHPFYIDRGTPIAQELLTRALSERGDQVDLLVYHVGRDIERPNLTLHRIPGPRWIRSVPPGLSVRKLICDAYLLWSALRLARRNAYDVVHASEEAVLIAMLLKRLRGLPYVYDMDSSLAQQTVEQAPWLRPLTRLLERAEGMAIRNAVAVAPVCRALAELAHEQGAPLVQTLEDISQIPPEQFRRTGELRDRLGIAGSVVLYVGNLAPYQGLDLLLESGAALKPRDDFHLVIAGGPAPAVAEYRKRAAALGITDRTHFIGPWPADRLGTLLAEADILVSPRTRGINTPMKIFPYLHSGRPLLATDITSHNQILDASIALLAAPDPAAFAAALEQLLDDATLRQRLGDAGRAFAERNHTFAAYRARVDALYDQVEAARSGTAAGVSASHAQRSFEGTS